MTDKLISMAEFILNHPATTDYEWQLKNHLNYANFLKTPLQLGHFLPVLDGEVLEEPNINDFKSEPFCTTGDCKAYRDELDVYNKAKSRRLFEGFYTSELYPPSKSFEVINDVSQQICIWKDLPQYFVWNYKTIEEMAHLGLTLTPYAKELIYGN